MSQPPGRATSQTLHLGSYVHNLQGDSGPGSHVYSLKCHPSSYTLHVESHIHNLQGYTLPDHALGITHSVFRVSPLPRPYTLGQMFTLSMLTPLPIRCTWGHMSTVSWVTLLPKPSTWGVFMVYIHSVHGDLLPDPAPRVRHPVSTEAPFQTLHVGSHVHSP